jgi:FtsZ-interacting cell division protein YlmF
MRAHLLLASLAVCLSLDEVRTETARDDCHWSWKSLYTQPTWRALGCAPRSLCAMDWRRLGCRRVVWPHPATQGDTDPIPTPPQEASQPTQPQSQSQPHQQQPQQQQPQQTQTQTQPQQPQQPPAGREWVVPLQRGLQLHQANRWAEAASAYTEAVSAGLPPSHSFQIKSNLGLVLLELKRHEEAIQIFDDVIAEK